MIKLPIPYEAQVYIHHRLNEERGKLIKATPVNTESSKIRIEAGMANVIGEILEELFPNKLENYKNNCSEVNENYLQYFDTIQRI